MAVLRRADALAIIEEQGQNIVIPGNFTKIDFGAFQALNLTSVVIPDSIKEIGSVAFFKNRITEIQIGSNVKRILTLAFSRNQLSEVIIPKSVREIGVEAFAQNKIISLSIPDSVRLLGSPEDINSPNISSREDDVFKNNPLVSVVIPETLENLAFSNFDTSVEIKIRGLGIVETSTSFKLNSKKNNIILTGNDSIDAVGNNSRNFLEGNDASNKIKGKAGEDFITGNLGRDILSGGDDDDTFIFLSIQDSGNTNGTRDVITDFTAGDSIDLTGIDAQPVVRGNQTLDFIGAAKFTESGQVRFKNGLLSVNIDDDLKADFVVKLKGVTELFVDSLIL